VAFNRAGERLGMLQRACFLARHIVLTRRFPLLFLSPVGAVAKRQTVLNAQNSFSSGAGIGELCGSLTLPKLILVR